MNDGWMDEWMMMINYIIIDYLWWNLLLRFALSFRIDNYYLVGGNLINPMGIYFLCVYVPYKATIWFGLCPRLTSIPSVFHHSFKWWCQPTNEHSLYLIREGFNCFLVELKWNELALILFIMWTNSRPSVLFPSYEYHVLYIETFPSNNDKKKKT